MEPSFCSIEESLPQYETSPSPAEQLSAIEPLVNSALQIGETRYLIDLKWYDEWHRFATLDSASSPGPIDNSSLFKDNSFLVLRDWLSIDIDVIPVPEEAWEKLVLW
ncbi:Ubiquitin carboxyl-terminal hydrolase 15 [Basidiobolus ranarum]|uniref:Ubiquitin carboxyl-terminal hydrolase 15 n=1 Tax=Basidiobolus ranarum TaxID=34480 RepID=A0ABR2X3C6_9FUNG